MNNKERAYAILGTSMCLASALLLAFGTGPVTLTTTAGAAVAAGLGGVLGNVSDRVLCRALRRVSDKVLDVSRPSDSDTVRVVRRTQLQALQILVAEFESSVVDDLREQGWDRSADIEIAHWQRFAKRLNDWCEREKHAAQPVLDAATTQFLKGRIDGLLKEPATGDPSSRVDALWREALDALLVELDTALGKLPEPFVSRLRQEDDGWRAVSMLLFADAYKNDEKVFRVLAVELLHGFGDQLAEFAQANIERQDSLVATVQGNHSAISSLLLEQCGVLGAQLGRSLENLREELKRPANETLTMRVGDIQAGVEQLLQRSSNHADDLARHERLLRTLLIDWMRESVGDGETIDGRFGIAAEDVNAIVEDKSSLLFGRTSALAELDHWQASRPCGVRWISAAAGVGKSSLLATWTIRREAFGDRVVRHFFSRNYPETIATTSALEHLLRQMRCQLGHASGPSPDGELAPKDRIHHLLQQPVTGAPMIVVLDGLDEAEAETLPALLPARLGKGIYVVLGVRQQDPSRPPRIVRDWCSRARVEWLDLPNADADWTRCNLPTLDQAALDEWLAAEVPEITQQDRARLTRPLMQASEGLPLFARFLVEHLRTHKTPLTDVVGLPGFRVFAERELQAVAELEEPVDALFTLLTLTLAPISEVEITQILGQRVRIRSSMARWFRITGERGNPRYAFAHPRLAMVFAEIIPQVDRNALQERLVRHFASWSEPGNDYALRYGLVHLHKWGMADAVIERIRSIEFHVRRLERFPDWDSLSESMAMTHSLSLSSEDRRRVSGLAQCQPVLNFIPPRERPDQLRFLAADFLEGAAVSGRLVSLLHPERLPGSSLRRSLVGHTFSIEGALLLDHSRVLSWSHDSLRTWDLQTGASNELCSSGADGVLALGDERLISWSYLFDLRVWDLVTNTCVELVGHTGSVRGVLVLDDEHVLSWSFDQTLREWDLATGESLQWRGHNAAVNGAILLRDGRVLSWDQYGSLRVWSRETGCSSEWLGHSGSVYGAMALDDQRALTWGSDSGLYVWDLATGAVNEWRGHAHSVNGALMQTAGSVLSWSDDGTLRLWDTMTGTSIGWHAHSTGVFGAFPLNDDCVLSWGRWDVESLGGDAILNVWNRDTGASIQLSVNALQIYGVLRLNDQTVVAWSHGGALYLCDCANGKSIELANHSMRVNGALRLDDGGLLTWASDGVIRVWDLVADVLAEGKGRGEIVFGVLPLCGGGALSLSAGGTLRAWEPLTGRSVEWRGDSGAVDGALVLDARSILSWSYEGTLCIWDRMTGRSVGWHGHAGAVNGALRMDENKVLSWGRDGTLCLWDRRTAQAVTWHGHRKSVNGVLLMGNDSVLSWSDDGTLRSWERLTSSSSTVFSYYGPIVGAFLLEDGRILSWGGRDFTVVRDEGEIIVWDPATTRAVTWKGHTDLVQGALQLDQMNVLTWSSDGTVRVWDVATGDSVYSRAFSDYSAVSRCVNGVLLLDDGGVLAWSSQHVLRKWNRATGESTEWRGHADSINGVLSLDDGRVLSWSKDGTLRIWTVDGQTVTVWAQPFGPIYEVVQCSPGIVAVQVMAKVLFLRLAGADEKVSAKTYQPQLQSTVR